MSEFLSRHFAVALALVAACSFLSALPLVWLMRRCAPGFGLVDKPGERKIHCRVTPLGGGVAIVFSLANAFCLGWLVFSRPEFSSFFAPSFASDLTAIYLGGVCVATLGLIDDFRRLSPQTKIFFESIVALALFAYGMRITLFVDSWWFSLGVTWLWFLLITNAFNLLDNMDGLSAGVAAVSGAIFLVVALQTRQWEVAFLLTAMLGSVAGFLCYNFPPATIFMGDCGSLLLGYLMAVLTIHATFYQPASSVFPVALPLLVMAVPLFDTASVVYIRWREKRPIFQGDARHFSHRLVKLGLSQRQAVLTIYLVTFATGVSATLLYRTDTAGGVVIVVQILAMLAVIRILEQAGAKSK